MEGAVRRGDLRAVEECIRIRSYWSAWKNDASLLVFAIEKGYEDIALALLAAQTLAWEGLRRALDMASDKGLERVVQALLEQLPRLLQDGTSGESSQEQTNDLLLTGSHVGDISPVLQTGSGCEQLSEEQMHELFRHACREADFLAVRNLLESGCSVNLLSREEQEALLLQACSEGDLIVAETLIINGCNVNNFNMWVKFDWVEKGYSYGRTDLSPFMIAAHYGHEEIVKKLILAGAEVGLQDSAGYTALHYAAEANHIPCGILLVDAGASVRIKNKHSRTPLDLAYTAAFRKAIKEAASFTTRKTLFVIGNSEGGKSTLITALQAERNSLFGKIFNRFRKVDDNRKRTTGIETVTHCSQEFGEVLFFDFAGQHEYHGPHQVFLESLLSTPGVSMTLLLVVKATEEEEAILHQLHRWLTPVALMATTANSPQVIVIGSFLDRVKSKEEASAKLTRCIKATRKDLEELPLQLVGKCLLNCRQPQSEGMDQLCRYLEEIPVPEFKATHTGYSLAWVLSQIRSSLRAKAVQLQVFSAWLQDNKDNLPKITPPPEEVCQDLTAAGYTIYLPNKEDPPKGWLVLDLPSILHDVYGTLFSQCKVMANEFGLLRNQQLTTLFSDLDVELVQLLLVCLEFCIPVDPSVLKVEMQTLTQSEDTSGWLFFPALLSAKPPEPSSKDLRQQTVCHLCWQLQTSKKHSISARVLQTILLRLAAHFVVKQRDVEGVQRHCCSIWWNGITWQSRRGVDVAVCIADNRVIRVVSTSDTSADKSYRYLSDVISDILSVVRQLSPNLAAAAYIVHPWKMAVLHKDAIAPPPPEELFLVEDIRNAIADHEDYTLSCKDSVGHSTRLPVSDLFGQWSPSLKDIERILWTQPVPSQPQSPAESSETDHTPTSTNPSPIPTAAATDLTATSTAPANGCPLTPTAAAVDPLPAPTPPLQPFSSIPPGAQALLDASAAPSLNDVNELIATQVAAKWPNLAIKLGVKDFLIDVISEDHPRSCVAACQDMLRRWLREERHTGGEERTWPTLLTALGRADFGELERSLRSEHFRN